MANEGREFSFSTRRFQLGETDVPLGDSNNPDQDKAIGIVSSSNTDISDGAVSPDWSAIPDSGDLHARYDATQLSLSNGNAVNTWPDETGNGHDLTGTAPTYVASGINGNPVVRHDGVDDFLSVAFSALSQPNHIFVVGQWQSLTGIFYDSDTDGSRNAFASSGIGDNEKQIIAGSFLNSGPPDTTGAHIYGNLYDSANSVMRTDGSQTASGDAGTQSLSGFTTGVDYSGSNNFGEVDIGEILIYPQDKSGIQGDVESYLADKWGITI